MVHLAASIIANCHKVTYLSDNQSPVSYLNSPRVISKPLWTIKLAIEGLKNLSYNNAYQVRKIHRSLNSTTHVLASQQASLVPTPLISTAKTPQRATSTPVWVCLHAVFFF